jgi:hypothetical protein
MTGCAIAHETGKLTWGTWVCDCDKCRQICLYNPMVLLVIKSGEARTPVMAGNLARSHAESFLSPTAYVREVFVAQYNSEGSEQ